MREFFAKHFVVSVFLFAVLNLGLGYRHIWQDEAETAERGASILEYGVPKTIDAEGRLSLNTSGSELEESDLHRYTPWVQFYAAAAGLSLHKKFGVSKDRAVRIPFAASHALTSGLISFGLASWAGIPVLSANLVGTLFGLQTVRVLHNRTARYHALLDLFLCIGLIGLGLIKHKQIWGWLGVSAAIIVLPQIQPLSGSLFSLLLGLLGFYLLFINSKKTDKKKLMQAFGFIVLPGLLTLGAYLALTRVWLPRGFGFFSWNHGFRGIKSFVEVAYSALMYMILTRYLWKEGNKAAAKWMWLFFAVILLVVRGLDLHEFSQTRYYLATVLFFLFAPFFLGWVPKSFTTRTTTAFLVIGILLPELAFFRRFATPFHGLHVIASDFRHEVRKTRQPLHELFDYLKQNKRPNESVAADYVPQLINWYLPNTPIALLPTIDGWNAANRSRPEWPKWSSQVTWPDWHFWYPSFGSGHWNCLNKCDFFVAPKEEYAIGDTYDIFVKSLNQSKTYCVQEVWQTNQWVNAPFRLYKAASLSPTGQPGQLVLARQCSIAKSAEP